MCKFKYKESRVTKNQVTITKGTNKGSRAHPKEMGICGQSEKEFRTTLLRKFCELQEITGR